MGHVIPAFRYTHRINTDRGSLFDRLDLVMQRGAYSFAFAICIVASTRGVVPCRLWLLTRLSSDLASLLLLYMACWAFALMSGPVLFPSTARSHRFLSNDPLEVPYLTTYSSNRDKLSVSGT